MKRCPKCGETKPFEAFSGSKKYKDGMNWCCKECVRAYSHKHYEKHKEAIQVRHAEYQRTHREQARVYSRRRYAKNPDYFREWAKANRDKTRAATRRWQAKNPEKVQAIKERFEQARPDYYRENYRANKAHRLELSRQWYEANRDRKQAKAKEWRKNNPLAAGRSWRNRRYRIRTARAGRVDFQAIYERDKGICQLCYQPVSPEELSFDHTIPISKGGAHSMDNITVAHLRCNWRKGSKIIQV